MSTNECPNVFQGIQEGKLRYAILKIIDGEIKLDKVRQKCAHTRKCAICVQKGFQNVRAMCVRAAVFLGVRRAVAVSHVFG